MPPDRQTVCLCMIVKDEAHVIGRCLASVRPVIDHWVVVDTGSSDGTQDIVRASLAGLPGELVERPWVDFAHNRSEALALARPHADYSLVIDADDELVLPPGFAMPPLDADSYTIDIEDTSLRYHRPQLFANALPWRYVGVLHEFPACDEARNSGRLAIVMRRNHDGARRRNPSTYRRDAAILERALETETDPFLVSRYTFYLAQSYRDAGEKEKSRETYLARSRLGFWQEEVYVALLQAARLEEALGHGDDDVIATYARATAAVPTRAEALHGASRLCRLKDRFEEGYWLAKRGAEMPAPAHSLFVEPWVYETGLLDELGVNAYWCGRYEDSRDACERLLATGGLPDDMRGRIEANLRFATEKLQPQRLPQHPLGNASADIAERRPVSATDTPVSDVDIAELLSLGRQAISIVDVGAASFGEKQFYQPLLDRDLARLTSFEPDPASHSALVDASPRRDTILRVALGDGATHALNIAPGGMTSILQADQASYDLFDLFAKPPFSPVAAASRSETISTTRLDDVEALQNIDFFKIDVQGAELMILRNGRTKLRECSILQVEMPFVGLYKDQPTFGDIDAELRAQGFMVHGFATIKRLPLHPYDVAGSLSGINQLIDLDMIYVRDMRVMADVPTSILRITAVAADICYGSFDLTLRCLSELVRRGLFEVGAMQRYARAAARRKRIGYIHHTPFI